MVFWSLGLIYLTSGYPGPKCFLEALRETEPLKRHIVFLYDIPILRIGFLCLVGLSDHQNLRGKLDFAQIGQDLALGVQKRVCFILVHIEVLKKGTGEHVEDIPEAALSELGIGDTVVLDHCLSRAIQFIFLQLLDA